jgi:hypothetical protein
MSLQSLRQWSWLRTAIAVLVLCFALGTIAHAGHHHVENNAHTHEACNYCVSFGALVDSPSTALVVGAAQPVTQLVSVPDTGVIATRTAGVAQARAPPLF